MQSRRKLILRYIKLLLQKEKSQKKNGCLFISNIDDFALDYIKIVPLIALVSVAVLVIIYIIGLIIPIKRLFYSYVLLVFSLALGFYIQGNFLNPAFNSLNGKEIAWSEYKYQKG